MNIDINISKINKYFSQIPESKSHSHSCLRVKISKHSYLSVNEANISYRISKIPYYSNFFSILYDYELLNLSELNEDLLEKINNNDRYYLFKYNDRECIDFTDNLYNYNNIKKLILDIIDTFRHIFNALIILNDNNICYFNISPNNIVFLKNNREKPVINNFKLSINLRKQDDINYIFEILNNLEDYTYKPIEIHILFYIYKHNMSTISYTFIEEFCENYVNNLHILRLFSDNYKKTYKDKCIEFMKRYINRKKDEIIDDIIERSEKWDVYGISVLYLHIFGCLTRVFSLKETSISKITLYLSKNIDPDSDKRMSLQKTLNEFDNLLNNQKDWKFINQLNNVKLKQLFDELEK